MLPSKRIFLPHSRSRQAHWGKEVVYTTSWETDFYTISAHQILSWSSFSSTKMLGSPFWGECQLQWLLQSTWWEWHPSCAFDWAPSSNTCGHSKWRYQISRGTLKGIQCITNLSSIKVTLDIGITWHNILTTANIKVIHNSTHTMKHWLASNIASLWQTSICNQTCTKELVTISSDT